MMKTIFLMLTIIPFGAMAQFYNAGAAEKFIYKEIVDTIFINDTFFVPGDTIRLGNGSAPDKSFMCIHDARNNGFFGTTAKYLPREMSNTYLIYLERKRNKNRFFSGEQYDYSTIFYNPKIPDKKYKIDWFSAIENHEIILRMREYSTK